MHSEGRINFQARFGGRVAHRIGIQLLLDPFRHADLLDPFDVAGARAVGQAVQCMKYGFVGGEFGYRKPLEDGILLGLFLGGGSRWRVDSHRKESTEGKKAGEKRAGRKAHGHTGAS